MYDILLKTVFLFRSTKQNDETKRTINKYQLPSIGIHRSIDGEWMEKMSCDGSY